ncbi:MAG: biotin transporter BioY [Pseudomonadota bacterium]
MLLRLVFSPLLGLAVTTALGAALIAGGAQVSMALPGTSIPQTLQTLGVLLAGGLFGPFVGAASVVAYLALGAAGVPVFATGSGGWDALLGPTGGYLWGFLVAAIVIGFWPAKRTARGLATLLIGCLVAHLIILSLGAARLSQLIGWVNAYERGVEPFLLGGAAKSAAAAAILWGWRQMRTRTRVPRWLLPT